MIVEGALPGWDRPIAGMFYKEMVVRVVVTLFLALILGGEAVWAQQKPVVPLAAVSSQGKLTARKKVLYVCRQLDLSEEQRQQAHGLIVSILETTPETDDIPLARIFQIVKELEDAQKNGDKETEERLSAELRSYGQNRPDSSVEVLESLQGIMTDAQKAKCKEVLARLERNPSGALRPVDVFRELNGMQLNPEQEKRLQFLRKQLIRTTRSLQTMKDNDRFQIMNGLLTEILNFLNPEQQHSMQLIISRLRPDLAYRMRVMTPDEEEAYLQETKERGEKANPDEEPQTLMRAGRPARGRIPARTRIDSRHSGRLTRSHAMRGASMLFWLGLGLICAAAKAENDLPESAINDKVKLAGQRKMIYVVRQLDLTDEQAAQAQGLIDSIDPRDAAAELDINRVRQLYQEIEKFKKEGNTAKVDELTGELQRMGSGSSAETEHFDNLKTLLTEEQKPVVDETLNRLARNPSGSLRPIDLVRGARGNRLTAEQAFRLGEAQKQYRKKLYPDMRPSLEKRLQLLNFLNDEIRNILTTDQLPAYDLLVRRLRPDLIDEGARVVKP